MALVLGSSLAGCSFSSSTGPSNSGPFSDLVRDIQAAGITLLLAAEGPSEDAKKGELYLTVKPAEGQDATTTADKLVSLVQEYKAQLQLHWLHVLIMSDEGFTIIAST